MIPLMITSTLVQLLELLVIPLMREFVQRIVQSKIKMHAMLIKSQVNIMGFVCAVNGTKL